MVILHHNTSRILKIYLATVIPIIVLLSAAANTYGQSQTVYKTITIAVNDVVVRNAAIDLQRYLAQANGIVPKLISSKHIKQKGIVIAPVYMVKQQLLLQHIKQIGTQGYIIKQTKTGIILTANSAEGLTNAIYGYLKELGFEFTLGSEVIPGKLPPGLLRNLIVKVPAFKIRGALPWHNFLNSPTTWNEINYRAFTDQIIRSGANFISFHTYDKEPFAAVIKHGKVYYGNKLANTSAAVWGTQPMSVNDFLFGTDKLYDVPYFGAKTTLQGYNEAKQVAAEQAVLKRSLLYAKSRGIKISMGFAAQGDPLLKHDIEKFVQEFTHCIKYYACLDYIYLWQEEAVGATGFVVKNPKIMDGYGRDSTSRIIDYGKYYKPYFGRIINKQSGMPLAFSNTDNGKIARMCEGARMVLFAKTALRILSRYKNAPKLVIAGWGGEERLLSEEYYEGLDKLLPTDVVFSSLENIIPKKNIDKAYFNLPPRRERWPIPWLENDGDQWHPQPYLNTYEPMARDLLKSHSQGFLGVHWRTREVADNFAYLVDFAWDTTLTRNQFIKKRFYKYGPLAGKLTSIYSQLDDLGYRWIGDYGEQECYNFTWSGGEPEKVKHLSEIKQQLDSLLTGIKEHREELEWMSNRMNWVINYYQAEVAAQKAIMWLDRVRKTTDNIQKAKLANKAHDLLAGNTLSVAMQTYASRITSRGEYGVLATINAKAGYNWYKKYLESCKLAGIRQVPPDTTWRMELNILIPDLYGSCIEGERFDLKAIIPGNKQCLFYYKILGNRQWKVLKMHSNAKNWVQTAAIPPNEIKCPGFEYKIITTDGAKATVVKAVTVMPKDRLLLPVCIKKSFNNPIPKLTVHVNNKTGLVTWNDLPYADYYQVFYNGKLLTETPVNFFPLNGLTGQFKVTYVPVNNLK